MAILYNNNPWGSYDSWRTTDVWGDRAWEEEYKFDWVLSLVKQENPDLDDYAAEHIATERYSNGYYDDLDF